MAAALKNFTFSLPPDLVEKLKTYAKEQYVPSINAAARDALENYVKEMEKRQLRQAMQAAACDPLFMKDLEDSMKDFENVDREGWKLNE